jgi:hypothetical protein
VKISKKYYVHPAGQANIYHFNEKGFLMDLPQVDENCLH